MDIRPGESKTLYRMRLARASKNTVKALHALVVLGGNLADQLQVDVHKISTTGGSAGGGEIHYLTWVYHALRNNAARYTPVSMVYTMAQLDYPVQNMVRSRFKLDLIALAVSLAG